MSKLFKILVTHRPILFNQLRVGRFLQSSALEQSSVLTCTPKFFGVNSGNSSTGKSSSYPTCLSLAFLTTVLGLRLAANRHELTADVKALAFGDNKKILQMITDAKQMVQEKNYHSAKMVLQKALELTETTKEYSNITQIYDLLVSLAIQDGRISEAEEMLVRFIEKLVQIGFADTDNQIVRYKLKLSRLYQIVGNTEMAEIGYQNCVSTQENKIKAGSTDPATNSLYMSSLFWYGRFLTEGNDLVKAQHYMKKALENERKYHVLEPIQLMVFLFHTAEISFKLNEYADSMKYLTQGLEVCLQHDPENHELPVFLVKMGVVCYHLELYKESRYWCEKGLHFARLRNNHLAEEEATMCLKNMEKKGVLPT